MPLRNGESGVWFLTIVGIPIDRRNFHYHFSLLVNDVARNCFFRRFGEVSVTQSIEDFSGETTIGKVDNKLFLSSSSVSIDEKGRFH